MSKYLIDYENVYIEGLDGLENLTEDDEVCIFYTKNRCGMTFDLHKRFLKSRAAIKLLEVSFAPPKNLFSKTSLGNSTKNALDLQLTLYLGFLLASDGVEDIFIISKDNDFGLDVQFCSTYLEACDKSVYLFQTIQKALDKDIIPEPEETEEYEQESDDETDDFDVPEAEKYPDFADDEEDEQEKMYLANQTETSLAIDEPVSSTLINTVVNLLENNGISADDDDFVNQICIFIKTSDDLLALNNNLAALFRDGEKVKQVYHVLKPQFTLLKNF